MQASLHSAWRRFPRGSLPSVAMVKVGDVLVSDIKVGALQIGAETTVAELANAVIAYNDGWQAGDQVTFFYGQQTTDAVTGIPRARIYGFKVMLNPGDSSVLWEVVSELGFSSVGGKLGMSGAISDGAAVWIHSREDSGSGVSGLKVSTQFLWYMKQWYLFYSSEIEKLPQAAGELQIFDNHKDIKLPQAVGEIAEDGISLPKVCALVPWGCELPLFRTACNEI